MFEDISVLSSTAAFDDGVSVGSGFGMTGNLLAKLVLSRFFLDFRRIFPLVD